MLRTLYTHFAAATCNEPKFFGLKPWYHYLQTNSDCTLKSFTVLPTKTGASDFVLIGLAVIDDLLMIAGLVAIAFIIYAGVLYVTSEGSPEQTQKAQGAIKNSLIGLLISVLAIAAVRFVAGRIT